MRARMKTLAKTVELWFTDADRAGGRHLLRRKRVTASGAGPWFEVRVRASDGDMDVHVVTSPSASSISCPCERFTQRGSCAHAWAAVLAIDRLLKRSRDRGAERADGDDGGIGEDVFDRLARKAGPRELDDARSDQEDGTMSG